LLSFLKSRWLPTLQCAAYAKPLINAALGFDSYLVMHSNTEKLSQSQDQRRAKLNIDSSKVTVDEPSSHQHLGCYFCNDIIAGSNSRSGRPLDEQCTVTRPGLSFIAGGLCAELLVALLHATQSESESDQTSESINSKIPHQIRGFLPGFSQLAMEGSSRFPCCVACSSSVVTRYGENPCRFVKEIVQNPKLLEEISGIVQMTSAVDLEECDWEEDEVAGEERGADEGFSDNPQQLQQDNDDF
jgi:ubiquitin-like modifier-activating enzyme ATG7